MSFCNRKKSRFSRFEILEDRRCCAVASNGWDGVGKGSAELTYYIGNLPTELDRAKVESAIESALQVWSDVIDVEFTRTSQPGQTRSLDFNFARLDGAGGTLAQAYLPADVNSSRLAGDVTFDSSEKWEVGNSLGASAFDLLYVAVHEIGHALGLDHHDEAGSVMAPYANASSAFTGLGIADIDAALAIYAPAGQSDATQSTQPTAGGASGSTIAGSGNSGNSKPGTSIVPSDREFTWSWTFFRAGRVSGWIGSWGNFGSRFRSWFTMSSPVTNSSPSSNVAEVNASYGDEQVPSMHAIRFTIPFQNAQRSLRRW